MTIFTTTHINNQTPTDFPVHTNKQPVPVGEDPNQYFEASEFNTFNNKINLNTLRVKQLMENSNEFANSINNAVKVSSDHIVLQSRAVLFPAMTKGESKELIITNTNGVINPDGIVWLGGFGGIVASHKTWFIARQNTTGGTFEDVGHQFTIITQKRKSFIQVFDHFTDFPTTGEVDVIYVADDEETTYYWSANDHEYVSNGTTIKGELINSTTFHDMDDNLVIPGTAHLYIDVTDNNKSYLWNGSNYVPINNTVVEGGSGIQYHDPTNKAFPIYDVGLDKLVDSKMIETPQGVVVNGTETANAYIGKCIEKLDVATTYDFNVNNLADSYNLQLVNNTTFTVSNQPIQTAITISIWLKGAFTFLFPSGVTADPDGLTYDGLMWNLIIVQISKGSTITNGVWKITNQKS